MALDKVTIPIDFTGGLETKTDAKLVLLGKLTTLENGVFDSSNTITKDGGYDAILTTVVSGSGGAAITTGKTLARRKDELLLETSTGLYTVIRGTGLQGRGTVQRESNMVRTSISVSDVARKSTNQIEFDAAFANSGSRKLSLWVWVEGSDIHYVTIDENTKTTYGRPIRLTSSAGQPKAVWDSANSTFRIFYITTGGDVCIRSIAASTPMTIGSETVIFAGLATAPASGGCLDVTYNAAAGLSFFAFRLAAGGFRVASTVDGTAPTFNSWAGAGDTPDRGISVDVFTSGRVGVFAATSANGARAFALPATLASFTAITLDASIRTQRITCTPRGANMRVVWEDGGATTLNTAREINMVDVTDVPAVVASTTAVYKSVGLVSEPFTVNSSVYVLGAFYSALQSTIFVLDISPDANGHSTVNNGVIARVLSAEAGAYKGDWGARPHLPAALVDMEASGIVTIPILRRGALTVVNGVDVTPSGLSRLAVRFTHTDRPLIATECADDAIFGGGNPYAYDGQFLFEAGFHTYPDDDQVSLSDVGGGLGAIGAGTYQYCYCYESYDGSGRRWLSTPSVPKSVTVGAAATIRSVIPTDRLTRRSILTGIYGQTHKIVVFRTENAGTIFYRTGTVDNNPTVDTVTFDDNAVDASIIANEPLYTSGGVLEYGPFPAYRVSTIHQDRLFMAGLEDPYEVRYTEQIREGWAPNTNEIYSLHVPTTGGEITALASVDDKLVICCETCIWYVFGSGPDRLGQFDSYSPPQLADSSIGCRMDAPNSLVTTPDGLWFRAAQGARLLGRGMNIVRDNQERFVGSEVDSLMTGCVAARAMPLKQQVRFYTGSNVLVYDYQWRQWSKFTDYAAVYAEEWLDTLVHMRSNGTLFQTGTSYLHDISTYVFLVETAWVKPAGIQGYQRVYSANFLGTYAAQTGIRLEVGYNYADTYTAYDGETTSFGSASTPLQFQHRMATQKCEAVRFRISEVAPQSGQTAFGLSNFTLVIGVKKGAMRLASAKRL